MFCPILSPPVPYTVQYGTERNAIRPPTSSGGCIRARAEGLLPGSLGEVPIVPFTERLSEAHSAEASSTLLVKPNSI